jgi:hypothetical protein
MKKIIILATLSIFIIAPKTIKAQQNYEATEYMNDLTQKVFELDDETWQYLKAVTKGKKASKVDDKRQTLIRSIKTVQLSVSRKKEFNGSTSYRDGIVGYLDLRYTVLKEDYDKILDMEEIAEQSYDAMEAYILAQEKASEKLDSAFNIMTEAQKSFAEQYKIPLSESRDKQALMIQKASETLSYYNDIYLIFFKSYKQEAYVLDAISRNDISGIEQNNGTFKSFNAESLESLKKIKSYKGDVSLLVAAKKTIAFYEDEANNEFSSLSDFYLKKEEFEKLQKKMESKNKKDISNTDITNYNNAINAYNEASSNFNKSMESLYERRSKMLNEWNKKVDYFINNHSN